MHDSLDVLSEISELKYFWKLDLIKGYYCVPVRKDSKKYTALQTSDNNYHFNFPLLAYKILLVHLLDWWWRSLGTKKNVLYYFDDILVRIKTLDEHLTSLKDVLNVLKVNGLAASPVKTEIAKKSLVFLGYKKVR